MSDSVDVFSFSSPALIQAAQEMRKNYRAAIPLAGVPDPVAEVREIAIHVSAPARKIPLRLYVPLTSGSAKPRPVVLFIHGGGFVSGDFDTHDVLARALANGLDALVVAVDYRLAPEYPFPAGLADVYAALCWLAANAVSLGGDPDAMVICGDSAGGNLAAAASILARDGDGPKIAAQWIMYACLGHGMSTPSWQQYGGTNFPQRSLYPILIEAYTAGVADPSGPLLAPLEAELSGLPPALIQVGELDPLRDENIDYAAALRYSGVHAEAYVYQAQQHGFLQFFKDTDNNSKGAFALAEGFAVIRRVLDFKEGKA